MRIAMFTNTYYPFVGGVPISIERLSKGLKNQGHQVVIFAPSYEEDGEEELSKSKERKINQNSSKENSVKHKIKQGMNEDINQEIKHGAIERGSIEIHRFEVMKHKLTNGCVIPKLFDSKIERIFRQYSFDVIHVHHPMLMGYTAMYLSKRYNIPMVYTYHTRYEFYVKSLPIFQNIVEFNEEDGIKEKVRHKLFQVTSSVIIPNHNRIFMNQCDAIIAPTESIHEFLVNQRVVTPVHILPTGISCPSKKKLRVEKNFKKHIEFITIARLEEEKNLFFLVHAMELFKKKNQSSFHLSIVGEGSIRKQLQMVINQKGLSDNITLLGSKSQDEIATLLQDSDLFLFSSKSETQGIVLLEAMSHQLPVVAIEASGVRDVVIDDYNGIKTMEDENSFVNAISKVMKNNDFYHELGEGAYEMASKFDYNQVALEAEKIYLSSLWIKNRSVAHAV